MNIDKKNTCAFTGHRFHKLPGGGNESSRTRIELIARIETVIVTMIEKMGITHFISGMAVGVDMYAAQCVLRLKYKYPWITLEAALPCRCQDERWNKKHREDYNDILSMCDKITVLQDEYTKNCMMKRNIYMVDNADVLLAVWDESPGGTGNTVKYALKLQKKGTDKKIFRLDPNTLCLENLTAEVENEQIGII